MIHVIRVQSAPSHIELAYIINEVRLVMELIIETLIGAILLVGIAFCFLRAMAKLDGDYAAEVAKEEEKDFSS